jgi:hypothetical protein
MKRTCVGLLAVVGLAAGCGGNADRVYDVSGTVTWNGQPVPMGLVFFDPDVTKGGTGSQGYANIKDGKFTTAVDGRGVRGGSYAVRVLGYDGKPRDELPFGQPLFNEYETKKDLPDRDSELNLDVPKKR